MSEIGILKQTRALIFKAISNVSLEQLLIIPNGFKNNILWNLGHIVITQQRLKYKLSQKEMYISDELNRQLMTGTSPADWQTPPDYEHLKSLLMELPEKLEDDYQQNRFASFQSYTTATGIALNNIDEAISFNNFHEGVHLGVILSLKKFIS